MAQQAQSESVYVSKMLWRVSIFYFRIRILSKLDMADILYFILATVCLIQIKSSIELPNRSSLPKETQFICSMTQTTVGFDSARIVDLNSARWMSLHHRWEISTTHVSISSGVNNLRSYKSQVLTDLNDLLRI
jgi:hypothetical protein